MNKLVVVFLAAAVLGVGAYFILSNQNKTSSTIPKPSSTQPETTTEPKGTSNFSTSKKSLHYESNIPEHEAILPVPPINVVINFNFDLAKPSEIKILMGDSDYGVGEIEID